MYLFLLQNYNLECFVGISCKFTGDPYSHDGFSRIIRYDAMLSGFARCRPVSHQYSTARLHSLNNTTIYVKILCPGEVESTCYTLDKIYTKKMLSYVNSCVEGEL